MSAGSSGILLVSGKPGCGKSVLAKYVQTRLSTDPEVGYPRQIAYFFFNGRGKEIEQITSGMIRALLYQIFRHRPSLIHELPLMKNYDELKKSGEANVEWPLPILWNLILSLRNISDSTVFYFIIDSLDEAKTGDTTTKVVDLLEKLASWNGSRKFKIFLTSRPPTLLQKFDHSPYPRIWLEKPPDSQYVNEDVETYISNQVTLYLKESYGDSLEPVIEKLRDRSNGVFLWVDLVMKRLKEEGGFGTVVSQLVKIVEDMPEGMEELYRNILSRLDTKRTEFRRIMLQWVLFAERPLTMEEFRIVITMNHQPGEYDSEAAVVKAVDLNRLKLQIESHCGGLVEFNSSDVSDKHTVIQLIHQSAKDFLLKNSSDWFSPIGVGSHDWESAAHLQLAETCLAYLSFDAFLEGPTEDIEWYRAGNKYRDRLQHYRLLKYAALYWPKHLNMAPDYVESSWQSVCKLTQTTSKYLLSYQVSRFERYLDFSKGTELLHLVSELGYEAVVRLLLGKAVDVDSKDFGGQTPLSWAAENGHEAVVRLLLEKAVDVDSKDSEGRTPLWWAARYGHEAVVQLLKSKIQ
jgi:Ankyrin repeats (3 copies)/NACHT domain